MLTEDRVRSMTTKVTIVPIEVPHRNKSYFLAKLCIDYDISHSMHYVQRNIDITGNKLI